MTKTFEEEFANWIKSEFPDPGLDMSEAFLRQAFFAGYMRGHEAAKQQALAQIAKAFDPIGQAPEMVRCPCCDNGQWESECCNGGGGCSCNGQRVQMGACHVCGGTGKVREDMEGVNTSANAESIRGLCFTGSGPRSGYWAGR